MIGVTITPEAARSLCSRQGPVITQPVDRDENGQRSGALVNELDRVAIIDADRQRIVAVADVFMISPIISHTGRIPDGPEVSAYIEVYGDTATLHIDMGLTDEAGRLRDIWDEIGMAELVDAGTHDFIPGREAWWLLVWPINKPIPVGPGPSVRALPKGIVNRLAKQGVAT